MKKRIALAALFISVSLFAQNKIQIIDSIVNSKIEDNDPGLMIGIVKDGTIIYEKYRGLAYLPYQMKMDQKTKSNIASIAKQYTALMILDLALKDQVSLEDDIRTYLPTLYKKVEEKIKIRHVLNHTSGIRDYVELMSLQNKVWWKQVGLKNDDIIDLLEKQEDLAFKPGSQYTYSNSGYNILAEIIERVSGQKFTDYSKQFFRDLGMKETLFIERYAGVIPYRAEPYADWGDGVWLQTPTVTKTAGEGFLYTTLKDQLLFEQAIQNANQDNNILLIKSQQSILNSEIKTYGFGLELDNFLDRKAVHHSGATGGYNSQMVRFLDEKLTIFAMSNNGNISTNMITKEIARALLPEIKQNDQYNSRLFETIGSTKEPQILGQYHSKSGYLTRIVKEEGKTYFRQGQNLRIELIPEAKNKFHLDYDSKSKLVFYDREMALFEPSGEIFIYKRSSTPPASYADLEALVGSYESSELDMSFELRLTEENKLLVSSSNRKGELDVEVFNRNELLASNFIMKVQRDQFDRVTDILLSLGRAKNNRFKKKTNLKFQPKIKTEDGSIQVTTIGSRNGDASDILLTKNYPNGNEIWSKQFGGNSYDKASSILATEDGYLIIGSTSSYGNGNYDMFVIKTDKKGKKLWQNTYGNFYNEYGYSADKTDSGYLIKGTIQNCTSNTDVFNRTCTTNVWFVSIDENGKELSNQILEQT
ncbi:serine hydrolase domain-containing protein [Winogradskyella flava]|uniref:serine hydrolase domain-containing protein n=1 Tax=Winogradskyella flava TaxID=1884876 RepID=UPI0024928BA2|nr:serine hydrolase domain-containing protein [Winogradskyella flava]